MIGRRLSLSLSSSLPSLSSSQFYGNRSYNEINNYQNRKMHLTALHTSSSSSIGRRISSSMPTSSSTSTTTTTTGTRRRRERPRVLILGTGWAGYTLARRLNKDLYDVRLLSPTNHFLFTPLLPSTAVGTLEFRAIQEPVRTIPKLGKYYQAKAVGLNTTRKVVHCKDIFDTSKEFTVGYEYLCIAAGNKTNTFNTPGIDEMEMKQVFFLKNLYHARAIRNRVLKCFERATNPTISKLERQRYLSFVIVGGGPTSCEFTSELYDFIHEDVSKWFPDVVPDIKVTLVEAGPGILGSFDQALSTYYLNKLQSKKIHVRLGTAVTAVEYTSTPSKDDADDVVSSSSSSYTVAKLSDDTELPFGTMVWSAGLAPVQFITDASKLELERGRVIVDEYLRVPGLQGRVFALGDCATVQAKPLPPTASVAEQQAYYLSDCFNTYYKDFDIISEDSDDNETYNNYTSSSTTTTTGEETTKTTTTTTRKELPLPGPIAPALMPWPGTEFLNKLVCTSSPTFVYKNRGAMAGMGWGGGVTDLTHSELPVVQTSNIPVSMKRMSGFTAFLLWRTTYLTKQLSITNMILIPMYWFKAFVFGRDISRF